MTDSVELLANGWGMPVLSDVNANSLLDAVQNLNPIQSLNNYLLTEKNKTIHYNKSMY